MRSDAFEKGALPVADAVEFSARLVAALSEAGDLTPEWRGPFEKVGSVAGAAAVGGAVGGDLGLHIVRGGFVVLLDGDGLGRIRRAGWGRRRVAEDSPVLERSQAGRSRIRRLGTA
jgi:hypothetical protein